MDAPVRVPWLILGTQGEQFGSIKTAMAVLLRDRSHQMLHKRA